MKLKIQAEEGKRREDEATKRRVEDSRRREIARLKGFRHEQKEKQLQNESRHVEDKFLDLNPSRLNSKLMDEDL